MNSIGNGFGTITDYAYTDKCDDFGGSVDDFTNAIDNFMSNGGNFVCWLTGHMHNDMSGYITAHSNQLAFVFDCVAINNKSSNSQRILN